MSRVHIDEALSVPSINESFKSLLLSPPDFMIRCNGFHWLVHSEVISQYSRFFDIVCHGNFKESSNHIVELHDDCVWSIAIMLSCCYLGYLSRYLFQLLGSRCCDFVIKMVKQSTAEGNNIPQDDKTGMLYRQTSEWQRAARVYILADKYGMDLLKRQAAYGMGRRLPAGSVEDMTKVVEFIGLEIVKRDCTLLSVILDERYRLWTDHGALRKAAEVMFTADDDVMAFVQNFLVKQAGFYPRVLAAQVA